MAKDIESAPFKTWQSPIDYILTAVEPSIPLELLRIQRRRIHRSRSLRCRRQPYFLCQELVRAVAATILRQYLTTEMEDTTFGPQNLHHRSLKCRARVVVKHVQTCVPRLTGSSNDLRFP